MTPYLAFSKKSFMQKSAYRFDHFMGILNTLIRIFIFFGIYKALYGSNTEVDGITMSMVTTNFVLSMGLEAVFYVNVLSGSMIPLWFMPEWMSGIVEYSPFSSIYFTPVQIYLGQLSYEDIAYKCGLQLVWIGIIYMIGNLLWAKGKKKLVVQGG